MPSSEKTTLSVRSTLTLFLLAVTGSAFAGPQCEQCGEPCREYDLTPCTVMVKKLVLETRIKTEIIQVKEQREETYTVFMKKPVRREYVKERCFLADDVKTQTVIDKKCQIIDVPVTRTYTVKVPHCEVRDLPCECAACSAKGAKPTTHPTEVVIETKEQRMEHCTEPRLAIATTKKDITYCVKVPKKVKEVCAVEETMELVPVERKRLVDVCVCKVVKKPCEVTVCKWVPMERNCCGKCVTHHKK